MNGTASGRPGRGGGQPQLRGRHTPRVHCYVVVLNPEHNRHWLRPVMPWGRAKLLNEFNVVTYSHARPRARSHARACSQARRSSSLSLNDLRALLPAPAPGPCTNKTKTPSPSNALSLSCNLSSLRSQTLYFRYSTFLVRYTQRAYLYIFPICLIASKDEYNVLITSL